MPYFESDLAVVSFDENVQAVHVSWKAFGTGPRFRQVLEAALRCVLANGATSWIGDVRALQVIDPVDRVWLNKDWQPRWLRAGVRRRAVVIGPEALARVGAAGFLDEVPGARLESRYVATPDDARAWLGLAAA